MHNTPDYNNNLAFAPGDWSDSRVNGNTDRTASTIQLIEKIEELEKENKKLKTLLAKAQGCVWFEKETYKSSSPIWKELNNLLTQIYKVLI